MQATQSNVFVFKKSGLEPFLYADVGPEASGSTLTILSILARLGKDPWMEAARWAALPKAVVIEALARSIAEMPLAPSALAGAHDSASGWCNCCPPARRLSGNRVPRSWKRSTRSWRRSPFCTALLPSGWR
ncbi:hypothetical protein HN018_25570 (plasmid) [Lichenicola cladoniae]|uniref:Uncharacterized protein n=1 Tax=Lichenicola cladoniae TaxID=1484109 RepID=A0A6M8HYB2_9PROT|nr:hypothetical protein [Lichenicola cladoniae]NPD66777.1 hypothetical protein [Acetobacteraceae bacterium]QKE93523.1 hypothetical protein HN018_25570 [Lichenicola cladoniae]